MRNNREKVYTQVVIIKRKVYSYLHTDELFKYRRLFMMKNPLPRWSIIFEAINEKLRTSLTNNELRSRNGKL